MKQIVVDTSIVIKWFLPEKGSDKASKLKDEHVRKKIKICSCDLLLYEFVSAFKNYSKMKLSEKDFDFAVETFHSLKLNIYPLSYMDLTELFILSKKLDLTIYDCSYVLLAKKVRTSLYTADKKLFLASKTIASAFLI